MNSSLLKYFSYIIILLSVFMAHSSSKKNQCRRSFSKKPLYISKLNKTLKLALKNPMFRTINKNQRVEKLALDIINNRQFILAIDKKHKIAHQQSWQDIKNIITDVMTEKYIQKRIMLKDELRAQFIYDLRQQPHQTGNKYHAEFIEMYINDSLFREWIYKQKIVGKFRKIAGTPIPLLERLYNMLTEEDVQLFELERFQPGMSNLSKWRNGIVKAMKKTLPIKNIE